MARSEALLGLGFAALGALMLQQGLTMPAVAHIEVGPGLFPSIVGGLMVVMGLGLAMRAAVSVAAADPPALAPARPLLFSAYLAAPLVYLALTPWLGFIVTAMSVVAILAHLGGASLARTALLATATAILVHLLFGQVMRVPLPYGIGERLLATLPWG